MKQRRLTISVTAAALFVFAALRFGEAATTEGFEIHSSVTSIGLRAISEADSVRLGLCPVLIPGHPDLGLVEVSNDPGTSPIARDACGGLSAARMSRRITFREGFGARFTRLGASLVMKGRGVGFVFNAPTFEAVRVPFYEPEFSLYFCQPKRGFSEADVQPFLVNLTDDQYIANWRYITVRVPLYARIELAGKVSVSFRLRDDGVGEEVEAFKPPNVRYKRFFFPIDNRRVAVNFGRGCWYVLYNERTKTVLFAAGPKP